MKNKNKIFLGIFLSLFLGVISCNSTQENTNESTVNQEEIISDDKDYMALGKEIAKASFEVLSGNLKQQMFEGGTIQALGFCNTNAIPLSDSLSAVYEVNIQRVALDYRNPVNEAKNHDKDVFYNYSSDIEHGKTVTPQLYKNAEGKTVFYAPIILQGQCVVCHGEPYNQVDSSTFASIKQLYPNDLATGFSEGDLRGLWKITFNN